MKPTTAKTLLLAALLASACLPLGAHARVAQKPHLGLEARETPSHQGNALANSLTAPGLAESLCEHRVRSRCSGKERDDESGLDYFGARYFAGAQGRFTSSDPAFATKNRLNDPQQWNLYPYVRNTPLIFVDPDGRELRLASGMSSQQRERSVDILAEAFRRPAERRAIKIAAESDIKNTFDILPISDHPGGVIRYGTNELRGKQGAATNRIAVDVDKIERTKSDVTVESATRHELSHTEDINNDLAGFVEEIQTRGNGKTRAKAEEAERNPGTPDMSFDEAKAAVQDILDLPEAEQPE